MLFKSKAGQGHHHLYFVPEGSDRGISTEAKGHTHECVISTDEEGNLIAYDIEAGENPHVHTLVEVEIPEITKLPKEDDDEVVNDVHQLFKESYEINKDSYENADESENFVNGNQWDERDIQSLRRQSRACLTINESGAQINTLLGYQRNNRSDFRHRPVEASDAKVGLILDEVVKNILENCGFIYEESSVAEDQYVAGRGNFCVYMDWDDNIEGDIVVERYNWRDVFYGPYEKLDRKDCEYVIKQKMFSKKRLERMFPDKADDFEKDWKLWQTRQEKQTVTGKEYSVETGRTLTIAEGAWTKVDLAKKEYRLVECWRKNFRTEYILVDTNTNEVENITGVGKSLRNQLAKDDRFEVVTRTVYDMRVSKVAGNVLVSDEIVDVHDNDFDMVPVHAKYRMTNKCQWQGPMEGMKDVQREINHRHSQVVDIINKAISYMWLTDDNTFANPQDEEEFKLQATQPGFVGKVADVGRPPMKIEGGKVPVEVIQLMQLSSDKLYRISNIPQETQGDSKMQLSGAAIREKTSVALQANRYLFDNMNLAKKSVDKKIISLMQKHYSPERIVRLLRNGNSSEQSNPQMQEIYAMQDAEIMRMLENSDLMKYDIVVDTSPYSPTIRMANQILLQEMMTQGVQIPLEYYIEESDMPNKEKFLAMLNQQRAQQQKLEEGKQDTEIRKAMIAREGRQQGGPR